MLNVIKNKAIKNGFFIGASAYFLAACVAGGGSSAPEPEPDASLSFIAIGDMGTGDLQQQQVANAMADVCLLKGCDFAIGLGDNIYEAGVDSDMDAQFNSKFEQPYRQLDFDFYMALGNHDNSSTGIGLGLNNKKGEHQVNYTFVVDKASGKWQMPSRYYFLSLPQQAKAPLLDLFALDSNPLATSGDWDSKYWKSKVFEAQGNWFIKNNAKLNSPWKIAFAHHPYLSNGRHGNAGKYDGILGLGNTWEEFLEQNICDEMDLFISGHDHDLQWLEAVDSCGKTEFIVSGAGAKIRSLKDENRNAAFYQQGDVLGFFHLELKAKTMVITAYEVDKDDGQFVQAYQRTLSK